MNQASKESLVLRISGFTARAYVGIREVERSCRQAVVVDIETPVDPPADGAPKVDYDDICAALRKIFEDERFGLLEEVAARVGAMLRDDFGVDRYTVSCGKPKVHPDVESVRVVCSRQGG